jgi:circadian clock protein KaiB
MSCLDAAPRRAYSPCAFGSIGGTSTSGRACQARAQVIAVPTLTKKLPPPQRRLVGDMSNGDRVLFGLDPQPR